jgi:hypothetical protein
MKYRMCFVQLLILLCATGIAQMKAKYKFTSINEMGLLAGESLPQIQLQTINGVSYKTYSAGIGLGMDDYYERTFPLFVDLRKRFYKKETAPFLYGDVGYSFISKKSVTGWEMDKKGAVYYGAGIGYEIATNSRVKAVFDVGYSYKRFSRVIDNEPWRSSLHYFDTYDYSLNRISIKAGLRF